MPGSLLSLQAASLEYDQADPESIERFAKRLIGRTLREALQADRGLRASLGKGGFGEDLERLYFKLPRSNESRPDFGEAELELKSSPLKRLKDGRLVPKERVSLSMIDYSRIVDEEWETSAFLKKNKHILFVFYLFEDGIDNHLDYTVKYVGRWTIPDECMPLLAKDWRHIQTLLKVAGPGALSSKLTDHLEAIKKGSKGATAKRAFAFKPSFVAKYILPRVSWSQPILPLDYDERAVQDVSAAIRRIFEPHFGLTAREIAERICPTANPKAKNFHAHVTKAILGLDPDNGIEDVTVRSIRLDHRKAVPREHVSLPYFRYLDLAQQEWESSDLRHLLRKPFLFVVYQEDAPGGRRVLTDVRLWVMPEGDREDEVRRVWDETVRRIREGRADDLPKASESPVCHVRPHGRDSHDRLPTPANGMLVKKAFWLNNTYVAQALGSCRRG